MDLKILKPFVGNWPVTFEFGEAPDWYLKIFGKPHNGVDFGTPDNTEIRATDAGIVNFADNIADSDGKGIYIAHSWGVSMYWHLNTLRVGLGKNVVAGEIIGLSGHTGIAFGAHLHFGIKVNSIPNPENDGWCDPLPLFIGSNNPPPVPPADFSLYIVLPGDSLWKIAQKLLGTGMRWPEIFQINSDTIKDPNLIYAGQTLKIPNE